MLPFKLIYHERYDLNLGPHVFPSQKFRLVHDKLLNDGIAEVDDFLRPEPAADADILRVHTSDWVQKLKTGTLTHSEQMKLEVPYSPELVRAFWLAAGGTIMAAESALRNGFACNLGGGFHHAYPGHGEGFCAIHDVAVAIRTLQARNDPTVFTLSIHQSNNYPAHKPHSSLDINLEDGVEDDEYLAALLPAVKKSIEEFQPEMLFYVGGADPYGQDQLGGLNLSIRGLLQRDSGVFRESRQRNVPVVTTQAGGYARRLEDTVQIHVNTILAAKQIAASASH